jgi:hypothetical protein
VRVPADLYGNAESVNLGGKLWTRRRRHDGAWTDGDGRWTYLDTADLPGLIMLDPGHPQPEEDAWHCYLPAMEITMAIATDDVSPQAEEDIFSAWLDRPWSLLGLLSPVNVSWLHQPHRFRPLLRAVVDAWPALQAEGARYSTGAPDGRDLWSVPNNLTYMLANMGLSNARLSRPLPSGGLPELLERVADWNGRPARERWG